MELKINEVAIPEKIDFNYTELKQELAESVAKYETLVYTDENIKEAKADKANLNKLKKALNDERLKREREYMKPFNEFKAEINEIIAIIDKPLALIDSQVKDYEERKKEEKKAQIQAFYEYIKHPEWLRLEQIFNLKWLNASFTMKAVQEEVTAKLNQIDADMLTLGNLAFSFEAQEEYKRTLNLNMAIAEGNRLADIQKRKEEYQAKQERLKAEPIPVQEDPKPVQTEAEQVVGMWVNFSAFLTVAQAVELKDFFKRRGIEFKKL